MADRKCISALSVLLIIAATGPILVSSYSDSAVIHPDIKEHYIEDAVVNEQVDIVWDSSAGNGTSNNNVVGFIAAGVAVVFFGSNLVPVKRANTGDGMFYQWVNCVAIWHVGLIVHLVQGAPTFYPLAMLGGFLWATGNVAVVPIMKTLGLSLGILIWGSVNLLTGWASGRFGLFGINKDQLDNKLFNDIGVSLALVSCVLYIIVKPEVIQATQPADDNDRAPLIESSESSNAIYLPSSQDKATDTSWVDKLSPVQKRVTGILLATFAGCLYGFNFTPCIWIEDNVSNASQNGLDYVFSHFCGILLTSSFYFLVYSLYMRNKPQIGKGLILPSVLSGLMWGIAQSAWFIANFNLSESVSFPIITTGPGIIASLWGVFLFGEIRGLRNFLVLGTAFAITITGAVFTAFSK